MEPVSGAPPLFEDGFWARGDQDNGHSTHCCSALHLQLNDRGAAFVTDEAGRPDGGRCRSAEARFLVLMLKFAARGLFSRKTLTSTPQSPDVW